MLLPRVVAAALALRQVIIPQDYCQPQCPTCKDNIIAFDNATSCVTGSPFLANCGACQTCVLYYSIYNGTVPLLDEVISTLSAQLDRCDDSPVKAEVSAIASQVARISSYAALATKTETSSSTITPAATNSVDSASQVADTTSGSATSTGSPAATNTSTSTAAVGPGPKLSQSWIAGPVIGSILGMATVFVVIYCTRRKHIREEWELGNIKEIPDEDQESTRPPPPPPPSDDADKAMLHGDCVVPKEMANTEIIPPVELPALEPVGMELLTPRSATDNMEKDWPLPISPLPALFAMTEIRDERTGADSPRHDTFYHA
ncbi:hypothetical protein GLAREA_05760 [Glarea lozoyensis ATCC 20868]|uniref:Uncharacterized protein n=1 Tax=Glarea lozoyensis (strain ATCC 20868 / MF5171) TaxID=1116229 RepID=S3DDD6_GLAL2|nr:uncharacterized protein GLAREA_05760 [Glarea lozoyensis ATCC 20868]EPE36422.1 hypothetical protein GLAREA_05760 [Glarea lozoyensis ATCC 20868]